MEFLIPFWSSLTIFILLFLYKYKVIKILLITLMTFSLFNYIMRYLILSLEDPFPTMIKSMLFNEARYNLIVSCLVLTCFCIYRISVNTVNKYDQVIILQIYIGLLAILLYTFAEYNIYIYLLKSFLSIVLVIVFNKIYYKYFKSNLIQLIFCIQLIIINLIMLRYYYLDLSDKDYFLREFNIGIICTSITLGYLIFIFLREKYYKKLT